MCKAAKWSYWAYGILQHGSGVHWGLWEMWGLAVVSCGWIVLGFHLFVRKALSVHNDHATSTSWDHRHSEDWPGGANNSRKFSAQCSSDGHAQRERERESLCVCVLGRSWEDAGTWLLKMNWKARVAVRGAAGVCKYITWWNQVKTTSRPCQDYTRQKVFQFFSLTVFCLFHPSFPKQYGNPTVFDAGFFSTCMCPGKAQPLKGIRSLWSSLA